MAIFGKKSQDEIANAVIEKANEEYEKIRPFLKKDEHNHVVMLTQTVDLYDSSRAYTPWTDQILTRMQADGFTILDIRFQRRDLIGAKLTSEIFHTLVTYRYDIKN